MPHVPLSVRENSDWTQDQYVGKDKLLLFPSQHLIECNDSRASVGGATRQRAADPPLPLPQLPAGQQWRLLLRPHHRQPRVLRLQAGLTRLQLHLSLGIAQAQARGEGREAGEDQGDHRLHLRLRHHQPSHG